MSCPAIIIALTCGFLLPSIAWSKHEFSLTHPPLNVPLKYETDSAGNIRPGGPPASYTPEQKHNYYLGQLSQALEICGYFSMSRELKAFATDRSAFQRGRGSLAGADSMTKCLKVKRAAEGFLEGLNKAEDNIFSGLPKQPDEPLGGLMNDGWDAYWKGDYAAASASGSV